MASDLFAPPSKEELALANPSNDALFAPPSKEELTGKKSLKDIIQPDKLDKTILEGDPNGLGARMSEGAGNYALEKTGSPVIAAGVKTVGDLAPLWMGAAGGKIASMAEPNGSLGFLRTPQKANAPEISAAAQKLGINATPGMLSDSPTVQGLESSLHQAPTLGGALMRRSTVPVGEGMRSGAEGLLADASPLSPYQSGEKVKGILSKDVESKFAEPSRLFEDLRQYTKDIPSTEASTRAVSRNIMNIPESSVPGTEGLANAIVKKLAANPSADQIKQIKTMVGKEAAAMDKRGDNSSGAWSIYDKLSNLEMNTIKRGAIERGQLDSRGFMSDQPQTAEGKTIAQGMLGQLKSARSGYRQGMEDLGDLAQSARLGSVKTPGLFNEKLDSIPSEKLQDKLLPLDDVRAAQTLFKYSPKSAEELRGARLRDLKERSSYEGKVDPNSLLRNVDPKKINPETEKMLFGKGNENLDALRKVSESLPEKVGPSGTPQGMQFSALLRPWEQAGDVGRYALYKTLAKDPLGKLQMTPETMNLLKLMAGSNADERGRGLVDKNK